MPSIQSIMFRVASVFVASAIPNIAVGTAIGVEVWKAALMSGGMATLAVVQQLAQSYREKGAITAEDLENAVGDN